MGAREAEWFGGYGGYAQRAAYSGFRSSMLFWRLTTGGMMADTNENKAAYMTN